MTITIDRTAELAAAITAPQPAPATADTARADAPLPYWQDRPCPPWCMMSVPHQDHDMPGDRYHMSVIHHLDLTLEKPVSDRSASGELLACNPAFLTAGLHQHYRERDPQVILTCNGEVDIPFTITEADELAQELAALASRDSAEAGRCPSWCTGGPYMDPFIADRIHVSDYRMVDLALADPNVWYPPEGSPKGTRPEVTLADISVRLWQGWLEREAQVDIVHRDEYTSLTLAEARELAEALSSLIADARGGARLNVAA